MEGILRYPPILARMIDFDTIQIAFNAVRETMWLRSSTSFCSNDFNNSVDTYRIYQYKRTGTCSAESRNEKPTEAKIAKVRKMLSKTGDASGISVWGGFLSAVITNHAESFWRHGSNW
jgi:hypothetical protein